MKLDNGAQLGMKRALLTAALYFGSAVIGVLIFLKHVVDVNEFEEDAQRAGDKAIRELKRRREKREQTKEFVKASSLEGSAKNDLAAGLRKLIGKEE